MFFATLLQQPLTLGEVIKRYRRIDVMRGVVHDVVAKFFDGKRKNDMRRAFELHVVKGPLLWIVIPGEPGMSMLNERHESHELDPDRPRQDDIQERVSER